MRRTLHVLYVLIALSLPSFAQSPDAHMDSPVEVDTNLPDSPLPQMESPDMQEPAPAPSGVARLGPPTVNGVPQPRGVISLRQRWRLQVRLSLGLSSFVSPAFESAFTMIDPPEHYPREWSDGGGAFGRNYGAGLARHTTAGLTHFAVATAAHEDPRYYPSRSPRVANRVMHAVLFTVADRADSGRRMPAVSNFAGSFAGGFIGMTYEPNGWDDVTHAYQRTAVELGDFGVHNVLTEFSPEIAKLFHKLHMPDKVANAFMPEHPGRP